ncbi:MAG: DNA polymerase ligase N-terminal domain-containing protein [Candidatus Geothermarchaeales archaeon]
MVQEIDMSGRESEREGVYVIHRHAATRLHYDLRLEMDGVLKSWALPKEPPRSRGVRRLAIEVADHDLEYAGFEGEIPEGEYGAGRVEIWDRGSHRLLEREEKKIVTVIHGERLRGRYGLVMFRSERGKRLWLFFKEKASLDIP